MENRCCYLPYHIHNNNNKKDYKHFPLNMLQKLKAVVVEALISININCHTNVYTWCNKELPSHKPNS